MWTSEGRCNLKSRLDVRVVLSGGMESWECIQMQRQRAAPLLLESMHPSVWLLGVDTI